MIKWCILQTFVHPKNTVTLPSEELPSVITHSLPIGLPMPGSPIPLFLPFILVGYDEHDTHYNDYYSHIVVSIFSALLAVL